MTQNEFNEKVSTLASHDVVAAELIANLNERVTELENRTGTLTPAPTAPFVPPPADDSPFRGGGADMGGSGNVETTGTPAPVGGVASAVTAQV